MKEKAVRGKSGHTKWVFAEGRGEHSQGRHGQAGRERARNGPPADHHEQTHRIGAGNNEVV